MAASRNWAAARNRDRMNRAAADSRAAMLSRGPITMRAQHTSCCPRCPRLITPGMVITKRGGRWGCC